MNPIAPHEGDPVRAYKDPVRNAKRASVSANMDISAVIRGWDYEAGTINVRKVAGLDGVPKLQMRLDLGLLQMELAGRPDGAKPHECESLLDYFEFRCGSFSFFKFLGLFFSA